MSSQPLRAVAGHTLRHWTIDSRAFVGGSERPAPALPHGEQPRGYQFSRLASKLALVKSDLARGVR